MSNIIKITTILIIYFVYGSYTLESMENIQVDPERQKYSEGWHELSRNRKANIDPEHSHYKITENNTKKIREIFVTSKNQSLEYKDLLKLYNSLNSENRKKFDLINSILNKINAYRALDNSEFIKEILRVFLIYCRTTNQNMGINKNGMKLINDIRKSFFKHSKVHFDKPQTEQLKNEKKILTDKKHKHTLVVPNSDKNSAYDKKAITEILDSIISKNQFNARFEKTYTKAKEKCKFSIFLTWNDVKDINNYTDIFSNSPLKSSSIIYYYDYENKETPRQTTIGESSNQFRPQLTLKLFKEQKSKKQDVGTFYFKKVEDETIQ